MFFLSPPSAAGLDLQPRDSARHAVATNDDPSRQDFFTVSWKVSAKRNWCTSRSLPLLLPTGTAAVHAAWANWRIPRQLGKDVLKQDEIDVLGARKSGNLGRISLPRAVVGQLIALSSWFFAREESRTTVQGQIVDGGFEPSTSAESYSIFTSLWDWIPEELRAHSRLLSESVVDDVLLAILSLLVCVSDLRAKVSPLVVATDASECRLGSSRSSSLKAQGRVALQELQQATQVAADLWG